MKNTTHQPNDSSHNGRAFPKYSAPPSEPPSAAAAAAAQDRFAAGDGGENHQTAAAGAAATSASSAAASAHQENVLTESQNRFQRPNRRPKKTGGDDDAPAPPAGGLNGDHQPAAEKAESEEQQQRLRKAEAELARLQIALKERDALVANLTSRNKYLQGELSRQHVFLQYLSQANAELNELLTGVANDLKSLENARATRIVNALRDFSFKGLVAACSPLSIEGNLDFPSGSEVLTDGVNVSGWALSSAGAIERVEAFLGGARLGEVFYGVARPDVSSARPPEACVECGFGGFLSFDPADIGTGVRTLQIVVTDAAGNRREFTRLVIIETTDNLPVAVNSIAAFHRCAPLLRRPVVPELQNEAYLTWIARNEPSAEELAEQRVVSAQWSYRPLLSVVVPVYNPEPAALAAALESVLRQSYENWELCLVDGGSAGPEIKDILQTFAARDARVRVKFLGANLGIAGNSNEALKMAEGEFVALLDHDDELSPDALYENALLLNNFPEADMIYSDEDKLDAGAGGRRCEPFFKPDWSPDFFTSVMYTCHLGVYRRSLVEKIGGFRAGFDGAQDYDLVLRLIERTDRIHHIPKVLYHWRKSAASTALDAGAKSYAGEAQARAVAEHLRRTNVEAVVEPGLAENLLRVRRALPEAAPKVSIIIPTRDQVRLLRNCVESIQSRSRYLNYEIIVVDNNSSEEETRKYFAEVSSAAGGGGGGAVRVLEYPHPFNFAGINNYAAGHAAGELLLFLNNDTEVIAEGWLEAMIEQAVRPEVGAVGARLLYPNGMVQHAGVVIGVGGVAGHSHKFYPADHPGYFSRAVAIQNLSAVTGACMMVRREVFRGLGGFNERELPVAFNDVDFCLRVRERGLRVIYTPYAELYHHESISRGADHTPEKALRFQREVEYMLETWNGNLQSDPFYSPNLTLEKEDFSIAVAKTGRKGAKTERASAGLKNNRRAPAGPARRRRTD